MPTHDWTSASYDIGFVGDTILPQLDVIIPAGSTMKRFLIRGTSFTWRFRTDFDSQIYPLYLVQQIESVAGQYFGQEIFRASRAIPQNVTGWRDPIVIVDTYTWWGNAGDSELGANQRCSYGLATGPATTWRLSTHIVNRGVSPAFPSGRAVLQFSALYETP